MSDKILQLVGAAAFETDQEGRFLAPNKALAELFLGPGAHEDDLRDLLASSFYVLTDQRPAFIEEVRAADGKPVTEYVLLKLPGGPAWCRLRAIWQQTDQGERFSGLVVRLEPDEDWMPGELLAHMGWAYLRVHRDETIRYASQYAAKRIGISDPGRLFNEPWATTHWADRDACAQFIEEAWRRNDYSDVVEFQRPGRRFRVEVHATVRRSEIREPSELEIFWREEPDTLLEQAARSSALSLREKVVRLDAFESAIVATVAAQCRLGAAMLYRYHAPAGQYILRAEYGLPSGFEGPRSVDLEFDPATATLSAEPFIPADQWRNNNGEPVIETLISIQSPSGDRLGFLWVPVLSGVDRSAELWVRSFAKYLGIVVQGAESEAPKEAAFLALGRAVEILLSGDTSAFYGSFLKVLLAGVSAEAGSVFAVRKRDGEQRLCLVATTGIEGVTGPSLDDVTYRFGEGLTGTMAKGRELISLLDVDRERAQLGIGPGRFIERLTHTPATWLGCPVLNEKQKLIAYIRLVNRRVGGQPSSPSGFSEGDLMLVRELARVAGQFHDLEVSLREHQEVIARSFHELYAPLIAIRAHARYLSRNLDHPVAPVKCANIEADAENLLQILAAIDAAGREREPKLEPTKLLGRVIYPLRFGLSELAKRRRYTHLDVAADDLGALPRVWVDPAMMRQVFYNLVVNAIKYGPAGGGVLRVQMTWTTDKNSIRILVRDWGIGIAPGHETKVFEQYHRIPDAVARDPTGSGIGLFVVKRIVEQHGGSVSVTNNRNPTEFTIAIRKEPKK